MQYGPLALSPGAKHNGISRDILLLILLAILLFSAGLGLRDPWPPDEPRFALMAKYMVESGYWLFPKLVGELYADKPPLFMWAIASAYKLTGSLRLSFLLPSLIAGLISMLLVYDLGRRLWTRKAGLAAALCLLTIYQFTLQARTGQIDGFLCLFTTLGLYGLVRHLLRGPAWGWCWTGFAAIGFGVISKGVGILPLLFLLPYAFAYWRHWPGLSSFGKSEKSLWRWLVAVGTMLAAIALWLVPMLIAVDQSGDPALHAYRDEILFKQTAQRYANSWHHLREPWYLLEQATSLWLPATLLLPWLVPAWWRRLKRHDSRYLLLLAWILLVIAFFSLPDGKRGVYLLPATPALALAMGALLPGLARNNSVRQISAGMIYALGSLIMIAAVVFGWIKPEWGAQVLSGKPIAPWPWIAVAGALSTGIMFFLGKRRALLSVGISIWVAWILYGWYVLPQIDSMRSARGLMMEVKKRIAPDAQIAMFKRRDQFPLFSDRPITRFNGGKDEQESLPLSVDWLRQGGERWLLIREEDVPDCLLIQRRQILSPRYEDQWLLIRDAALKPGC